MTARVLVSACLLGQPVRYDGRAATVRDEILDRWRRDDRLVSFCPEIAGGFPVPRPPAEIDGEGGAAVLDGDARVIDDGGRDVTEYFVHGARQALEACSTQGIGVAVLKEESPSCGSSLIHDGSFSGTTVEGMGVTTALLTQHGIRVFNELQLREADEYLATLDRRS